jgi:hypothetical protein
VSKSRFLSDPTGMTDTKNYAGIATGRWQVSDSISSSRTTLKTPETWLPFQFLLAFAMTPMTAVPDPWQPVSPSKNAFVETWREVRRKRLSLREGRRLALQTMENAERARMMVIEAEFEFASRLEG